MANFDFKNLYLVNPCKLDDECHARAMHAYDIIDNAKFFTTFDEAIKDIDFLVATSAIENKSDKKHLRNSVLLEELSEKLQEINGKVGIVFGREDYGLFNEEIAACDVMLKISTSESYRSLNLSHAVALVLYSLFINKRIKPKKSKTIGKIEKEQLYKFFNELLVEINYPVHKKENTEIMFKRIMGRAIPSKWEYYTLMGIFSKTLDKIKNKDN